MAIRVREQLSTASARGDRGGRRSRQREFVVNDVLPGSIPLSLGEPAIVDSVTGVVLPRPGEFHPDDTFMLADSVDPRPLGDGLGSRVTVLYSLNGQFKHPDIVKPDDEVDYAAVAYDNVEVERQIPIQRYVKKTKAGNDPDGDPIIVVNVWEVMPHKIIEVNEIITVRVSVDTLSQSDRATLHAQANKVHTLPGDQKALFRPFSSTSIGKRLSILYQWERDSGTLEAAVSRDVGLVYNPRLWLPKQSVVLPAPQPFFIRDPFHILTTFPSDDPTDQALGTHPYLQIKRYAEVPDGWQDLPGNPGQALA